VVSKDALYLLVSPPEQYSTYAGNVATKNSQTVWCRRFSIHNFLQNLALKDLQLWFHICISFVPSGSSNAVLVQEKMPQFT